MAPPVWVVPIVLLVGSVTWYKLHQSLQSKALELSLSRIVMIEMVPSFVFAVTTIYLLVPAFYYLLLGEQLGWATSGGTAGITWRLATFVGAAALSLSPIGWISLLEDEVPDESRADTHAPEPTKSGDAEVIAEEN